jgi:murein DD-endopeptidase MepM/ murein hydrolase activator NlpD
LTKILSFLPDFCDTQTTLAKNDKLPLIIGGVVVAAAALTLKGKKSVSLEALGYGPSDLPKKVYDVPFANGSSSPAWPVVTKNPRKWTVSYRAEGGQIVGNGARRFMADRNGKYHAGVDIYANAGDKVIAMESGTIVNFYHFFHGTYALIVQHDSGIVVNYGEIENASWAQYGLKKGSRVKKGQTIARVGLMSGGSHMLHFETYASGTTKNIKILGGKIDSRVRNPTRYLLIAKALHQPKTQTVAAMMEPDTSVEKELMVARAMKGDSAPPNEGDGP